MCRNGLTSFLIGNLKRLVPNRVCYFYFSAYFAAKSCHLLLRRKLNMWSVKNFETFISNGVIWIGTVDYYLDAYLFQEHQIWPLHLNFYISSILGDFLHFRNVTRFFPSLLKCKYDFIKTWLVSERNFEILNVIPWPIWYWWLLKFRISSGFYNLQMLQLHT